MCCERSDCVSEGGNDILDHGPRENQIKMYKVTNAIRINHYLIAWQRSFWVTLHILPFTFFRFSHFCHFRSSFCHFRSAPKISHLSNIKWTLALRNVYLRWFWRWNFEFFFQNSCLYIVIYRLWALTACLLLTACLAACYPNII